MRNLFLTLILFISFSVAKAQIVGTYKKFELGAGIGLTQYTGDVASTIKPLNTRFGGEAYLRYNLNTVWALRANVGGYFISAWTKNANDPYLNNEQNRYAFNAFGGDGAILLEYNFFNFRGRKKYPKFSPYVFAGIGGAGFKRDSEDIGDEVDSERGLGIKTSIVLPFGMGIKFPLSPKFNWAVEFRSVKLFSDEIDGIYGDFDTRFPQAVEDKADMYYYLGVSVAYRFVTIKCPRDYPEPYFDFK
jgi:opacity protein-like surface antigen